MLVDLVAHARLTLLPGYTPCYNANRYFFQGRSARLGPISPVLQRLKLA